MRHEELVMWRGRVVAALYGVGITRGCREAAMGLRAAEVKGAALACELGRSRVERGLDRAPATLAELITLGRGVQWKAGSDSVAWVDREGDPARRPPIGTAPSDAEVRRVMRRRDLVNPRSRPGFRHSDVTRPTPTLTPTPSITPTPPPSPVSGPTR